MLRESDIVLEKDDVVVGVLSAVLRESESDLVRVAIVAGVSAVLRESDSDLM